MIPRLQTALATLTLLPLLWGVATSLLPELSIWSLRVLGPRLTGPYLQLSWGQILLALQSGALWGFACTTPNRLPAALAMLPAIWAFAMVTGGPTQGSITLILGFTGALALDTFFEHCGLAPKWWMELRIPTTVATIALLGLGAL